MSTNRPFVIIVNVCAVILNVMGLVDSVNAAQIGWIIGHSIFIGMNGLLALIYLLGLSITRCKH